MTKPTRLLLGVALLALSAAPAARACKYCWAANADRADAAQSYMGMNGPAQPPGDFPLDGAINQFQPGAASAALATPPPAGSVVTSAAELRPTATLPPAATPSPAPAAATAPVAAAQTPKPVGSAHWADAGLLGLAAAGGLFCWRTRRSGGSVN